MQQAKARAERLHPPMPQVNLSVPTVLRMWLVSACALLVVIQSSLGDSFFSLIIALSAVAAAVGTELLFLVHRGRLAVLKDGSAVASALILAILLPNQISPLYAASGAIFAMAVVKNGFGGLGGNWLNPAVGGWLFIRLSWPASFTTTQDTSPLVAADVPDGAVAHGNIIDFLTSTSPGIIADRGGAALLLAAFVLTVLRVNRFWIPCVYLGIFGLLAYFTAGNTALLVAIFSGGTLAAAFFLACDPVTSAKSLPGMFLAAAAGGALAFFFRFHGHELYGAVFAAALLNALFPLVRIAERRCLYQRCL